MSLAIKSGAGMSFQHNNLQLNQGKPCEMFLILEKLNNRETMASIPVRIYCNDLHFLNTETIYEY